MTYEARLTVTADHEPRLRLFADLSQIATRLACGPWRCGTIEHGCALMATDADLDRLKHRLGACQTMLADAGILPLHAQIVQILFDTQIGVDELAGTENS